jgi:hypothetical protein
MDPALMAKNSQIPAMVSQQPTHSSAGMMTVKPSDKVEDQPLRLRGGFVDVRHGHASW